MDPASGVCGDPQRYDRRVQPERPQHPFPLQFYLPRSFRPHLLVLPQHVWSGVDITTFKNDPPIYTGPYTLQKTIEDLGLFIWEKNPNYWAKAVMDPAAPYVVYRNAPTDADLENEEYKEGLIDALNSSTSYEYATILQDGGDNNVVICNFLDSDQRCIFVNCDPSRGALLASPKFRYAIAMLLNRQKILKDVWPVPTTVDIYPWPNYPNTFAWDNKAIADEFAQIPRLQPQEGRRAPGRARDQKGVGGQPAVQRQTGHDEHHHTRAARRL